MKIPDDDVKNLKTVGDAVDYIAKAELASTRPRRRSRREELRPDVATDSRARPTTWSSPVSARPRRWVATSPRPGRACSPAVPASRPSTEDWAADLPVRIAAPVAVEPSEVIDRVEARKLDRSAQFALIAAARGLGRRRLTARLRRRERLGVVDRLRHRRRDHPARPVRRAEGEGRPPRLPAHRPDAHAERPGRLRRPGARRPGRRAHPGVAPAPPAPRPSATASR